MTTDLVLAGTALAITLAICGAGLKAWRGWLDLKRLELAGRMTDGAGDTGVRIELADVRERLKRLELIANDVEL